jgi:hypothetical protein
MKTSFENKVALVTGGTSGSVLTVDGGWTAQ